jgi:L,D-transpeptidase YcbB
MLRTACSTLALAASLTLAVPISGVAFAADEQVKSEPVVLAPPVQVTAVDTVSSVASETKSDAVPSAPATIAVPATPVILPLTGPVIQGTPPIVAEPAPVTAPIDRPAVQAAQAPATPPPAFSLAAEIGERLKREKASGSERDDREAAAKFYDARQGEPVWVTPTGPTKGAHAASDFIATADDWGLAASAFKLPDLKITAGTDVARAELADAEVTLTMAALRYARHARGGRMDPTQLGKSIDRKAQLLAPASILADLAKSDAPDATLKGYHPAHPQFEKLRQKYLMAKAGQNVLETEAPAAITTDDASKPSARKKAAALSQAPSPASLQKKLLANMEEWRWMPAMGETHINPNIPEYMVRVVRGNKVVHAERIVTGKTDTPTPIFSDEMRTVVFQPFWNVPESIKFKELQPQLMRNGGALGKAGLKAAYNGREVNPAEVDWGNADMRQYHIFQPPGGANALGQVKFLFPNKHDVYMHDTPSKSLFAQSVRAYSHGCMRVRDPLKLAEVILSMDKGWDMPRVVELANRGPQNNEIPLTKKIPVHVTYFTTVVDEDGKLKTFNDIYGHEAKIHLGLEGKTHLIAQVREERYVPPQRERVASRSKSSGGLEDWMKSVFNF